MLPNPKYINQCKAFWAHVRSISQHVGYTIYRKQQIKVPSLGECRSALVDLQLRDDHLMDGEDPSTFGALLCEYFQYRADVLNNTVQAQLMSADEAKGLFDKLHGELCPTCPLPMNKQKGEKKSPAFLTGIVNMLVDANASGYRCDFDPRELTTVTRDSMPLRTLARRVDGAFPSTVNPIAVWEVKEYYFTTTFGSRVADGVYESLLDGMELEELREKDSIDVKHYLMVDARYTWWECGRSYLCRIIDMLHMGYVDEVLFGREVVDRLPLIVTSWIDELRKRPDHETFLKANMPAPAVKVKRARRSPAAES
jgi:hypothetical protein